MNKHHEQLYRRAVGNLVEDIRHGEFTPDSVPRIVQDMRDELEQCGDLRLLSDEVREELLELLASASVEGICHAS